ncbi:Peptidase M16 inactive domain protein [Clavibacter michiganensis subsp. michiganensis]|nr:Peptidase M16 inactive domain protein [Clavibacter michiganensis subsp. michiganensis]
MDHDALVARVTTGLERAGWDLSAVAAPVARRTGSTPVITRGSGLVVVDRPIEQTNILLGVPGLAASDDRRPALAMLNSVLGGGMSSRLFQEVREKRGLAYSVYSFGASYSDAGVFGLYAGCTAAKTEQVSRLMVEEFRKLAEENVTEEELARAFGQLSGQSALALEDSDTRMSRLGRSEITTGEYVDLDETLVRLSRVTAEDVRVLAADLISRPLSIAAVGTVGADAFAPLLETPALL